MSFELDFSQTSLAGRKDVNEDFAALVEGQGRDRERGAIAAIAAIADGVSAGGNGREAAQTTVNTLVNDYFGTPETWDTTVGLDRILSAHNGWLASMNRRRQPAVGLTTITALVVRVQGALVATLQDESRRAHDLPVLPLLKVSDLVDGLVVTALVADNGIHRIYQMRHPPTQRLYALKTLVPARAHDPKERATLAHEAWVVRRMQSRATRRCTWRG